MREWLFLIRFFAIVTPLPPLMLQAMLGVAVVAIVLLMRAIDRAGGALAPLLLLQLFAASSGFMTPARRGHYDLLLTAGCGRLRIAIVHWLASVLPGIAIWLVLAVAELAISGGVYRAFSRSGTLVAIALVSTIPWAANVALPRFTGALGWLLGLALLITFSPDGIPAMLDAAASSMAGAGAVAPLLYPVALIGVDLGGAHPSALVSAPVLSGGAMAWALGWIVRRDIPLEAAQ